PVGATESLVCGPRSRPQSRGLILRAMGRALAPKTAIDPTALPSYLSAMAKLDIITLPDPILRKTSAPVERVDEGGRQLADDILETMHAAPGVGLAAVQGGVLRRLLVLETAKGEDGPPRPLVMINPPIVALGSELRR